MVPKASVRAIGRLSCLRTKQRQITQAVEATTKHVTAFIDDNSLFAVINIS
jgi:hypothetical protein